MALAENVARLRLVDGHTIEEVAEATGLPPALIHGIEAGTRQVAAPRILRALARHFRISVEELTAKGW